MQSRILTFFMLLVLFPMLALAQSSGRLIGLVTDAETGEPLIGANVIIVGTSYGSATDLDGNYSIMNIDAGTYELKASFLGFQTVIKSNVAVTSGLTTYINFQLSGTDIATDVVTIVAEKELIKKDATSSIRTVSSEDIDNLPVRGVTNIVSLAAGVVNYNGEIHIRGGREDEVGYYLEGVSIVDPVFGGRAVTLGNDAVEEIQVEAGGFTAEFGGSNSGIIRSQLRSGGSDLSVSAEYITDNIGLKSSDDLTQQDGKRLGAYWYGRDEASVSISGPLGSSKIRGFYNFNYRSDLSQTKNGYPGFDYGYTGFESDPDNPANNDSLFLAYPEGVRQNQSRESFTHSGTLTFDFQPIKLRLAGTYTTGAQDVSGSSVFEIDNSRFSEQTFNNGAYSLNFTHVLNDDLFYKITLGYSHTADETKDPYLGDNFWAYGDSAANVNAGVVYDPDYQPNGPYSPPSNKNIYGWIFETEGYAGDNYDKSEYTSFSGRLDFTWVPNKNHYVKAGLDYKQHSVSNWSVRQAQQGFAFKEMVSGQSREQILYSAGVNNYGYDIYGNEVSSGIYKPREPVALGAYLQDKIELNNLILNIGIRYDYFDMDNFMLKDKTLPESGITTQWNSGVILEDGFTSTPTYNEISPRLSAAFPITDKTVFHAGFGKYVQMPSLNQAYLGYHSLAYEFGQSFFFGNPTGADLEPIRKTHYEVGFRQQLTDFMAVDITGYYDDIQGQIYFDIQDVDANSFYQSYNTKTNGDFSTTKGIEIVLSMRRYARVSGNVSFTYQDGRGTGSYPNSAAGIVGAPLDGVTVFRPVNVSPLTYNNPIQLTFFVDYRFADNDGGWLQNSGINFLGNYNSGHPFTRGVSGERDMENAPRFRTAIEPLNASMTPSFFNVDMKIDKTWKLWDKLRLNVNLRVINLFDTQNVEDVYSRSGAADDDGYLAGPGSSLPERYGEEYRSIYKSLQIDYNGFFAQRRQILLGFRLEY